MKTCVGCGLYLVKSQGVVTLLFKYENAVFCVCVFQFSASQVLCKMFARTSKYCAQPFSQIETHATYKKLTSLLIPTGLPHTGVVNPFLGGGYIFKDGLKYF
jgi:hypothetical protein